MAELITPADLAPFATIPEAKAAAMIADATALAVKAAPCLKLLDPEDPDDADKLATVKAVLRQALLRWNDAGTGVKRSETKGPFGEMIDTTTQRKGMFWPSEINDLAGICQTAPASGKAFMIDQTTPADPSSTSLAARPDLWFQNAWIPGGDYP